MEKLNLQGQEAGKRTFRDLYYTMDNTPPKKAFVQRMAEITMRSETTIRCWLAGSQNPDPLAKDVISRELGVPADELFPKKEKTCAQ